MVDFLCTNIDDMGSIVLCPGKTITLKSPDGSIICVISVGVSNELTLESPNKITIVSGKLVGDVVDNLEVGDVTAPLKKLIVGSTPNSRLKLPVGVDLYDP